MRQFPAREHAEVAMDADYMLACGIVWRKTADPDAGWELVEALAAPDPELRQFARRGTDDDLSHTRKLII